MTFSSSCSLIKDTYKRSHAASCVTLSWWRCNCLSGQKSSRLYESMSTKRTEHDECVYRWQLLQSRAWYSSCGQHSDSIYSPACGFFNTKEETQWPMDVKIWIRPLMHLWNLISVHAQTSTEVWHQWCKSLSPLAIQLRSDKLDMQQHEMRFELRWLKLCYCSKSLGSVWIFFFKDINNFPLHSYFIQYVGWALCLARKIIDINGDYTYKQVK